MVFGDRGTPSSATNASMRIVPNGEPTDSKKLGPGRSSGPLKLWILGASPRVR